MSLIVEKLRAIQLNSDFWTECPKVQNLQLNMEQLTSGHCVQKKKSFVVYFHTSQNSFFLKKLRERTRENPLLVRELAFSFGKQGGLLKCHFLQQQ